MIVKVLNLVYTLSLSKREGLLFNIKKKYDKHYVREQLSYTCGKSGANGTFSEYHYGMSLENTDFYDYLEG